MRLKGRTKVRFTPCVRGDSTQVEEKVRMMSRISVAVLAASLLTGCAAAPLGAPPVVGPPSAALAGIDGKGAYRAAGESVTCAGFSVALMADTEASRDRMRALYGPGERAIASVSRIKSRSAALPAASAQGAVDSTKCGDAGDFRFRDLPAGPYFVIARVAINPPKDGERDFVIMRAVHLRPGETRRLSLAP